MLTTSTFHRARLRWSADEAEVLREWGRLSLRARGPRRGADAALRAPYRLPVAADASGTAPGACSSDTATARTRGEC